MLFLRYLTVNKGESSGSVLFNQNIMWATDVIFDFLAVALKSKEKQAKVI